MFYGLFLMVFLNKKYMKKTHSCKPNTEDDHGVKKSCVTDHGSQMQRFFSGDGKVPDIHRDDKSMVQTQTPTKWSLRTQNVCGKTCMRPKMKTL